MNLISNSLKQTITQLEYEINMPHKILSDGEHYNIKIKKVNVKAEY